MVVEGAVDAGLVVWGAAVLGVDVFGDLQLGFTDGSRGVLFSSDCGVIDVSHVISKALLGFTDLARPSGCH